MPNECSIYGFFRPKVSLQHSTRNYINAGLLSQRAFLSNNLFRSLTTLALYQRFQSCACTSLFKHSLHCIRKIAILYHACKREKGDTGEIGLRVCVSGGSASSFFHPSVDAKCSHTHTHQYISSFSLSLSFSLSVDVCQSPTDYSSISPNSISRFWSIERDACVSLFCP